MQQIPVGIIGSKSYPIEHNFFLLRFHVFLSFDVTSANFSDHHYYRDQMILSGMNVCGKHNYNPYSYKVDCVNDPLQRYLYVLKVTTTCN